MSSKWSMAPLIADLAGQKYAYHIMTETLKKVIKARGFWAVSFGWGLPEFSPELCALGFPALACQPLNEFGEGEWSKKL